MLDSTGFDLWAEEYDKTVEVTEGNNAYPFAGYKSVLNGIYNEIMKRPNSKVLDIGFGTGTLTEKLYEKGHEISGIDFSAKMIAIAKEKMPSANLMEWDISNGLPEQVTTNQYDFIVSTYALHHLSDKDKVTFIEKLISILKDEGELFTGDVAYQTREALNTSKQTYQSSWDEDEFYLVADEITEDLKGVASCEFYAKSHCAGVLVITK